jgi:RND family efflux transporter MFP subunit
VKLRRLAATAVVLAACGPASGRGPAGGMPPMPVKLETVRATPVAQTSDYVAVLVSRRSVRVQPLVDGHITGILVSPGDQVKAGQSLMTINQARQRALVTSQRAAAAANRANLDYLRSQYERMRKLYARGAATREDYDRARSALEQAEASAAATAAQAHAGAVELKYYQVIAPQAGTVGDIPVRVGDLVTPQTLLTTLDDNSVLEAHLQIPAGRAKELRPGLPVEILDASGAVLAKSHVTFVSPRVDPDTQTVLAIATAENRGDTLRAGQFVHARVIWSERPEPTVPVLAVQSRAGQPFIWLARRAGPGAPLTVSPRPVTLGPIVGQSYPVLRGLAAGDQVVTSDVQKLRPGAPVVPAGASPGPAPPPAGEQE